MDQENAEKARVIRQWINPDERVTVDFEDVRDLNAEITGCSAEVVDLTLPTAFPHVRQAVTIPLSAVDVREDHARYTRDPTTPLQYGRLRLAIRQKRPQTV